MTVLCPLAKGLERKHERYFKIYSEENVVPHKGCIKLYLM
jgi:hypothetical protein